MLTYALTFAIACFAVALLLNLWRLATAPTMPDRILTVDTMVINIIALIVLYGAQTQSAVTFDAALLLAMTCDGAAYIGMALIGHGWMAFALMPLFALGGSAMPILQSELSERVDGDRQGALMGLISSLTSFVSIFGPLTISLIYFASRPHFPGLIWLRAAAGYLLCLPLLRRATKSKGALPPVASLP